MRVSCERDHERAAMTWDHFSQIYICPVCHYKTTADVAESAIPIAYRYPNDPLMGLLFGMAKETQDFDVEVIIGMRWPPKIEYPRPSLDKFDIDLYKNGGKAEIVHVDVNVNGPPVTQVHKDEVDIGPMTRSGSFVVHNNRAKAENEYAGFEKYVAEMLDKREKPKDWHLTIWQNRDALESDPLQQPAPRGLFTRETLSWIKAVVGYTWRLHTDRLRIGAPTIKWDLEGVKLYERNFDFSPVEKNNKET